MEAIILSIGDELVLGQTVDTNSAHLSAELARRGIGTRYHVTVADDRAAIAEAIRMALGHARLIIVSGGLGPTDDDLTRQGLADALGAPLILHEPSVELIRGFFQRIGRPMPDRNTIQAMHPRGTTVVPNSCGTAPGIKAVVKGTYLYVVPGVPREMRVMFEKAIEPELDAIESSRHVILTTTLNTFGLGESDVADRLGPLMDRDRNPKVGTTVANAFVSVRVRSEFADQDSAHEELEKTAAEVRQQLGPVVFGRDHETLPHALVALLGQRGFKVTTAESCTGGLLGKLITDVSGSSDVYSGGWVTYTNEMKTSQLGVDPALIEAHGAVSEPVARAMAAGALKRAGADLAASITGVAGPTGGTPDKPVGTVWVALAHRREATPDGIAADALLLKLGGDREQIRDRAAKAATQMLRLEVMGEPIDLVRWGKRGQNTDGTNGGKRA